MLNEEVTNFSVENSALMLKVSLDMPALTVVVQMTVKKSELQRENATCQTKRIMTEILAQDETLLRAMEVPTCSVCVSRRRDDVWVRSALGRRH